jgi:hypothetical protein
VHRGTTSKAISGGGAWMIAAAFQIIPNVWPNLLRPHPWLVGIFVVAGAAMFIYAAVGHRQSGGLSNSVGRDNSGDLINAKDSVVHKGDYHYHESTGPTKEELDKRFDEIETKINRTGGGVIINGIFDNDPLIYLDIRTRTNSLGDFLVCHNKGRSIAHNVQIQPIKLASYPVTFTSIGAIGADEEGVSTPTVGIGGAGTTHWFFHWLLVDWGKQSAIIGEWRIPMSIKYTNALNNREFTATVELVFYPVMYQMAARQPGHNFQKTFDFKNPQFRAEACK